MYLGGILGRKPGQHQILDHPVQLVLDVHQGVPLEDVAALGLPGQPLPLLLGGRVDLRPQPGRTGPEQDQQGFLLKVRHRQVGQPVGYPEPYT